MTLEKLQKDMISAMKARDKAVAVIKERGAKNE